MLQTGEILIILVIALIVLGPRRLPEIARKMGEWTSELRTAAREIRAGLESEVSEFKEVGRELKSPLDEVKKPVSDITSEVSDLTKDGFDWNGPKPLSGPTPEDAMRDLEEIQSNLLGEEE